MNSTRIPLSELRPERILITIPNWVGDAVMATAALEAVRKRFSSSHIALLMRRYVADVLAGASFGDEMIYWPERGNQNLNGRRRHDGRLRFVSRLRGAEFDLAMLFTNSFRSALAARLAGIGRRVGYVRDGRGWLLTDRLDPPRQGRRFVPIPALDYYNALARSVGCEGVGDRLILGTTPEDEAAADARIGVCRDERPLVVLNPGANYGSAKCWPAEKYAGVSDGLVRRFGARVVASLGPEETSIAERLRAAAREPIEVCIDPPLGLGPLKALVRHCDLLITNDTGPRHFAAAFDVPVITVFGSSDPAWTDTRFAKERIVKLDLDCQPCMKRVCPLKHHNCMNQLDPEQVLEQAEAVLIRRQGRDGGAVAQRLVRR